MTDDFGKSLRRFAKKVEKTAEPHEVSFPEVFNDGFMRKHTKFPSMAAMMEAGGLKDEDVTGWESFQTASWNAHVAATSKFASWQEMLETAGAENIAKRIAE